MKKLDNIFKVKKFRRSATKAYKKSLRRKLRNTYQLKMRNKRSLHRLSVFRSNKHISVQLIDDKTGTTVASASSLQAEVKGSTKKEIAVSVGKLIAEKAKQAKVKEAIFDKGAYKYHGRVAELANSVRDNGLKI